VRIIKAAMGYAAIPVGFPILVSERMSFIDPAFAWLMELTTIAGRSHAADTTGLTASTCMTGSTAWSKPVSTGAV